MSLVVVSLGASGLAARPPSAAVQRAPTEGASQRLPSAAAAAQRPPSAGAAVQRRYTDELLSCRVRGFFPFPSGPQGPIGWLFRDTHQAITVTNDCGERLTMDFMTAAGQAHPVWWDESVKWQVMLGQSIDGEVRIRGDCSPGSKLERLREAAERYDRSMNLYTNNCRIFCARMRREAVRLNPEESTPGAKLAADARLLLALIRASTLPMLYPLGVLFLCREGILGL